MEALYIFLILLSGIAGFFLGRASKKTFGPSSPNELAELREASQEALGKRTQDRKDQILEMMKRNIIRHEELKACGMEAERKGINRDDVEKLLDISYTTAHKYLNELEDEGKIRQIGVTGKNVYYMLAAADSR